MSARPAGFLGAGFLVLAFVLSASGSSAFQQHDMYGNFTKAAKDVKSSGTWLRVWRTQIWTALKSLQLDRDFLPLHIYMNGDSSFRQQKNFLCSILQPGFEQRGGPCWAVDTNCVAKELESTCYNSKLNIRVTYIENNCCSVERLAYLATSSHPPQPAYPTTTASNPLDRKAGGVHLNIRGAVTDESQATRKMAQSAGGQGDGVAAAAGAGAQAGAQDSAAGSANDKASSGGNLGSSGATQSANPDNAQQHSVGVGGTASGSADPAPAWAPGGLDNTTVIAYLNCGLHLFHLGAAREFECMVEQIEYEKVLQRFGMEAAQLYPGAPHIWMTSTYVCDMNFEGEYAQAMQEIRGNPEAAVAECVSATGTPDMAGPYAGDTAARERACRDGFFIWEKSRLLRERMVAALQNERLHSVASMGMVDGFSLTQGQCWASQLHDGRHFPLLVPAIVMELVGAMRRRLLPPLQERGGHRGGAWWARLRARAESRS